MLYVMGIVAIVMCVPITAIVSEHKRKAMKLKAEIVREEIELERLKEQNFIIETEKMKLELQQMKLEHKAGSKDLYKIE